MALAPLPPDYARPSLEEFKAAGITHVSYEKFFEQHEAELRKHYVAPPAEPSEEPSEDELLFVDYCEDSNDVDDTRPMGKPPDPSAEPAADDNPNPEADHEDS